MWSKSDMFLWCQVIALLFQSALSRTTGFLCLLSLPLSFSCYSGCKVLYLALVFRWQITLPGETLYLSHLNGRGGHVGTLVLCGGITPFVRREDHSQARQRSVKLVGCRTLSPMWRREMVRWWSWIRKWTRVVSLVVRHMILPLTWTVSKFSYKSFTSRILPLFMLLSDVWSLLPIVSLSLMHFFSEHWWRMSCYLVTVASFIFFFCYA